MKLRRRPAQAADVTAILELYLAARAVAMPYLPRLYTDLQVARWIADVVIPTGNVSVVETDGQVVGFAAPRPGQLNHLYVRPSDQGRGVGSLLLDWAKAEQPAGFRLYAFQRNLRARVFYEKRGFVAIAFGDGSSNEKKNRMCCTPERRMQGQNDQPSRSQVDGVRRRRFPRDPAPGPRGSSDWFGSVLAVEAERALQVFADRVARCAIFGAYEDDRIIGMIGLASDQGPKDAHKGFLWGFFVDPDRRGRGIGAALMSEVLQEARGRFEQVTLSVVARCRPALSLYDRFGFVRYGVEPRALKSADGYDDEILMILLFDR